jgi:hypothetical protein
MENLLSLPKPTYEEIDHLISSLPMLLIGLSKENEIVFWNLMAEKVFETDAADVMGLALDQSGVSCDWDKIITGISQSRIKCQPIRVDDIGFRRPGDEQGYLGITIVPLIGNDDTVSGASPSWGRILPIARIWKYSCNSPRKWKQSDNWLPESPMRSIHRLNLWATIPVSSRMHLMI